MIIDLPDLEAMVSVGRKLASDLRSGDVIALSGELGTGKTTLTRAILAALGHVGEVPSPTYTIIETYEELSPPVVHADFYRLQSPGDVGELGLEDYREGAALIAEWPECAGGFDHESGCLSIRLEKRGEGRRAIVKAGRDWQGRWS